MLGLTHQDELGRRPSREFSRTGCTADYTRGSAWQTLIGRKNYDWKGICSYLGDGDENQVAETVAIPDNIGTVPAVLNSFRADIGSR